MFPAFAPAGAEPAPAAPAPAAARRRALEEQARREGFEAGRREGRAAAGAAWSAELGRLAAALEGAGQALEARRAELAAAVEAALPRLVLGLARRVIAGELADGGAAARRVIAEIGRRLAGPGGAVAVRLSPADAEAFEAWRASLADPGPAARLRVEADRALAPGDWLLETGDGFLDGRVETALEAARLALEGPA